MDKSIRQLKTPEDFKKYHRELFEKACGPELWKFLEEKELEMSKYKRAPDDSTQWKCPWRECAHGGGLAGRYVCSARGEWWNPECFKYRREEDYLKEWKDEQTNRKPDNQADQGRA